TTTLVVDASSSELGAAGTFGFHPISPLSVPIQRMSSILDIHVHHPHLSDFQTKRTAEISYPPPAPVEPLSEVIRRLELVSAQMHNLRLAARNARNPDGKLELLEKTIEGDGADLANAVKGPNMSVLIPLEHVKLRDRPGKFFTFTGYLCDFTDQGILDLIVFYNNDFGIVEEDGLDEPIIMIIEKRPLPDDPTPSDSPPSYETVNAASSAAVFPIEKSLPSPTIVSPVTPLASPSLLSPTAVPLTKTPSSSGAKGKGRAGTSWFGFMASKSTREVQSTVLGLVRDLVKEQHHNTSAALAILESCSEACSGYDLTMSAVLQEKSIEGHTPMYWAIVKRPPEDDDHGHKDGGAVPDLLTALISYATPLNPQTIADIRHACLLTSDQVLFQRLRMSPEFSPLSGTDEMLLGANIPPDLISVENMDGDEGGFAADFVIAHFQKRMLVSKSIQLDFIARARMWRLEFLIAERSRQNEPKEGSWCISLSLLENSSPTWIDSRLLIPEPIAPTSNPSPLPNEGPSQPTSPSLMDRVRSKTQVVRPKPTISIRLKANHQLVAPPHRSRHEKVSSTIMVSLDESVSGASLQYTLSSLSRNTTEPI
ncbi:hypothetical protein H0H93_006439, partial [Arthromyces matolae]